MCTRAGGALHRRAVSTGVQAVSKTWVTGPLSLASVLEEEEYLCTVVWKFSSPIPLLNWA